MGLGGILMPAMLPQGGLARMSGAGWKERIWRDVELNGLAVRVTRAGAAPEAAEPGGEGPAGSGAAAEGIAEAKDGGK